MADETTPRPGFRGKCLYKTGKCNNERALKTSGQAHNLCDEHRHRQNEHQRKLDAKNRYARKDKRSPKDESPTNAMAAAARGHRYVPYGKVRMSPNGAAGVGVGADDMQAILGRNGIVASSAMAQPMMQFHAMGMDAANAMAASHISGAGMPAGSPEILPSGVVILPNGPQAPQMPYPSAMQDFDGIVVPLPSYLEGHERVEFRSRIYQKVLDFIAEECMRRFGAVPPAVGKAPDSTTAIPGAVPVVDANATPAQALRGDAAGERREASEASADGAATAEDTKSAPRGKAAEGEEPSGEKKASSPSGDDEKESDDAQPEDAEDAGDEAPRAKRATRSRVGRKELI